MRIEDAGTMPALTPFERETRKEIAVQSKTPRDVIAAEEDENNLRMTFKAEKCKLRTLINEGALTRRQRLVYELCYVNRLPDGEVADLLGITKVTVRRLRSKIKAAFERALKRRRKKKVAIEKAAFFKMTSLQKRIFTLHYQKGFAPSAIASKMKITERSVYYILNRIQKKIFSK
jgi:DNA-directed RNA polymerase specialized sigma24 family protein